MQSYYHWRFVPLEYFEKYAEWSLDKKEILEDANVSSKSICTSCVDEINLAFMLASDSTIKKNMNGMI